jgi:hypothetical protein
MNKITQTMLYRQSLISYAEKYGVTKAAIRYNTNRQYIYRWRKRYDGTLQSLADRSHRPHHHPNQHRPEEIKLIENMRRRNPNTGLVVFWVKLRQRGYTRSISGLYRFLRNGKVERSHRKDNEEFYASHKFFSFDDFSAQLAVRQRQYNNFPMRPLNWLSPKQVLSRFSSLYHIIDKPTIFLTPLFYPMFPSRFFSLSGGFAGNQPVQNRPRIPVRQRPVPEAVYWFITVMRGCGQRPCTIRPRRATTSETVSV